MRSLDVAYANDPVSISTAPHSHVIVSLFTSQLHATIKEQVSSGGKGLCKRGMRRLSHVFALCLMSFVRALPLLPHGSRLALTTPGWGRGVGTGGAVWPASEVLCRWMLDERMVVQGASVLELGSGTGAVGLFAAGCGASSVLLTDGDSTLCSLAADNARANRALMPDASVTTRRSRPPRTCLLAMHSPRAHCAPERS